MVRLLALVAVLAAPAALATGERIVLSPASNPLQETLCFSMTCVKASAQATVAAKPVKGGLEITVTMSTGQKRLTHFAPYNADGKVSSTDLVRATSLVLTAIEKGAVQGDGAPAPAKKIAHKTAKKRFHRLVATR